MITPARPPHRILMTTDTVGGVWTYALELCRELQRHHVHVVLATMGPPPRDEQLAELAPLHHVTLCEGDFRLEWMDDPWDDVARAGEWLLALEQRHAPDLIHLNSYAHGALDWQAPTLIVAHSCVLSWWEAVKGETAPDHWQRYAESVQRGLRAADLVLAPSEAMLAALERHYGALPLADVIFNGCDPQRFAPATKERFIFSAGRLWDEAKNVAALSAVAPLLEWPVRVAGDEAAPDGQAAPVSRVESLGRLSSWEMADAYARASIYALPARYEPFGLSAVEAGLSGCALVLGDIPSLREIWEDAAVFVPPDDHEALRAVLTELIAEPRRRRRLGEAARERAALYSNRRMADAYLSTYAALLEREEARTPTTATTFV